MPTSKRAHRTIHRTIRGTIHRAILPLIALALAPPDAPGQIPDVVFHNGTVITLENAGVVPAIAILGDRILAVGSEADILAMTGPQTELVDLAGRTLTPGFVEGHSHILWNKPGSLDEAQDLALSFGWTALNELNLSNNDRLAELQDAEADARLRLRVSGFVAYNDAWIDENGNNGVIEHYWEEHEPVFDTDRYFRLLGIKIFVDGAFSVGRGCWAVTEPYPDDYQQTQQFQDACQGETRGSLYVSQEQLNDAVLAAQEAGFTIAMHAMGDLAIDVALNALELAAAEGADPRQRHQVHHNALIRPDQFERYQTVDAPTSVRGTFFVCSPDVWTGTLGPDRFEYATNRYALPGLDIHAFAEGDFGWTQDPYDEFTVRPINPMQNLWGMVARKQVDADGSICSPEPWMALHEVSVEQGLRMLTIEPAHAVALDDVVGSLKTGKYADLVILSDNPLEASPDDLKDIDVLMTMVAGKVQFCSEGSDALCPITAVSVDGDAIPATLDLLDNHPNPFTTSTTIHFYLSRTSHAELTVQDVLGRRVRTLSLGIQAAGTHTAVWDGTDDSGRAVAAGLYLYRVETPDAARTAAMVRR